MIRNLVIIAVLISAILIGIQWLLTDSRLLAYIDQNANSSAAPAITFYVGELLYTVQGYATAEPYFRYMMKRFPSSPYAERAHARWLECLCYGFLATPEQIKTECGLFLQQYPGSHYAPDVQKLPQSSASPIYGELHTIQQTK
jgi:outer membrane protein assembly factor BamD (BamD/ComL family)